MGKYITNEPFLIKEDNIIREMKMLAKLYINEIINDIEEYKIVMNDIGIKIDSELEPKGRDIQKLANDQNYLAIARATYQNIETVNGKLRTRLSKLVEEY